MDKNLNNNGSIEDELDQSMFNLVNSHSLSYRNLRANFDKNPEMPKDYRKGVSSSIAKSNGQKRIYKSNKKSKDMKRKKIPKSLLLLLSAGILVGGIKAITLGVDHFQSQVRSNELTESQEKLSEMTKSGNTSGNMETYQQEDNSLEILNSDINNILQKYKEDPNSVTQEEVKTYLKSASQLGMKLLLNKVASAYNDYGKENDPYHIDISSDDLYAKKSNGKEEYTQTNIIVKRQIVNGINKDTVIADNPITSDYISSMIDMSDLANSDNLGIKEAINTSIVSTTQINNMANYSLHYEKGFLDTNEKLVVDKEPIQKDNTITYVSKNFDDNDR